MTRENASVTAERARLKAERLAGMQEGFAANPNILPDWYSNKTLVNLTARQRGYFVGRELRIEEMEGES